MIIAALLVRGRVKVLDSLVVDHRVVEDLGGFRVGRVLSFAHFGARTRHKEGKGAIQAERRQSHHGEGAATLVGQQRRDDAHLEGEGQDLHMYMCMCVYMHMHICDDAHLEGEGQDLHMHMCMCVYMHMHICDDAHLEGEGQDLRRREGERVRG